MPSVLRKLIPAVAAVTCVFISILITDGQGYELRVTAAAVVLLVCCWGFRLVSEGVAAVLFFLILAGSGAVTAKHVFVGFSSPAFWLVFSGLVLGKAIASSGLSNHLASLLSPKRGANYAAVLARIIVASTLFAFLVPSALGRIMILLPILTGLAERYRFSKEDNGYAGILLAGVFGTYLPAFAILPANLPNIILSGAAESVYGIHIGYMEYLLLHFPVLGLVKGLLLWCFLTWMFPAQIVFSQYEEERVPWKTEQKIALLVLGAALCCWMLDSLHSISPGWIGLGAALVLLVEPKYFGQKLLADIKIETLLFIACAISVGEVMRVSGLGEYLTSNIIAQIPLQKYGVPALLGITTGTGLLTSLPGIPSMFVPLAGELSRAADIPLKSMLMLLVPAFSTILLPYQAPPLIVAMHYSGMAYRKLAVACMGMALLTIVILFPLDLFWWKLIGF
ncbi:hypothetical protein D0S45_16900 [Marinifilum sp. JC120]|nr:hypothetical protein D0S45_16900 [Marinifilum sp. JC120]